MKIDLANWSEAEMDFIAAKDVLSTCIDAMFAENADKVRMGTVFSAVRSIESGLAWIDSGKYPEKEDDL